MGSVGGYKRKFEVNSDSLSASGPKLGNLSMKDVRPQKQKEAPIPSGSNDAITNPLPRGLKLINRIGGDVSMGKPVPSAKEVPPLLQRLSSSDERPSNGSFRFPPRPGSTSPTPTPPIMPMLSIKGAASKLVPMEEAPQPPTLIDRMQVEEFSHDGPGTWKRRRRPKAAGG